jgi:hypothetical protein
VPSDCLNDVKFRRIGCMTYCLMRVSLGQVSVMSGSLMVTSLVKPSGFAMVLCGVLVVLRCFSVVFRCFFCHFVLQV